MKTAVEDPDEPSFVDRLEAAIEALEKAKAVVREAIERFERGEDGNA